MQINIKKLHSDAIIPTYAKLGDAGMDITAINVEYTDDYIQYKTGLAFEIPEGYVMLIFPRSSNSKKDLLLCNSVGILDSGYRGELLIRYKRILNPHISKGVFYSTNSSDVDFDFNGNEYQIGDKVAQIIIIPYPSIEFNEVNTLSETERGEGGFGSTDIKK